MIFDKNYLGHEFSIKEEDVNLWTILHCSKCKGWFHFDLYNIKYSILDESYGKWVGIISCDEVIIKQIIE